MLHFTYEIYPSPDGQYGGITENGTWDGMMGELVNKVSTLLDISLVWLVKVIYWVLSVPSSLVVIIIINIFMRKRMKDLVSKETAVACRLGSKKRVVDEGQITTVKTLLRVHLGRCPFVRANVQSLLRLKYQFSFLINPCYTKMLSSQPMASRKKRFLSFEVFHSTTSCSSVMYPSYVRAVFK